MDFSPQNSWVEPKTAVAIGARSRPIVITVEHRIAETMVGSFLAVMSERRRIRSRDGARRWTLLQDLADPVVWIERFQFATWLDYVRHNERRTQADAANSDALRELWIDQTPPLIRRLVECQTDGPVQRQAWSLVNLDVITDTSHSA